jgi:zinc protease
VKRLRGAWVRGRLVLAGLACLSLQAAAAPDPEISKFFTLDNGLKVFLLERHVSPLVSFVVAVNCGSKDETPRTSGLAHLLEHCALFRGTATRSGEEIGRQVRRRGAFFNARTGLDLTEFETCLPSSEAEFGLTNLKDILFDLRIVQPEVEAEAAVILQELNLVADDPFRRGLGLVYGNVFSGHPYALPLQGTPETLSALTADDLRAFYESHFSPANMGLAAVGDFSLPDMEARVRAVFGSVPAPPRSAASLKPAPPPERDVEMTVEMDVQKAYCFVGMAGPDFNHPDKYALDALAQVLGRGFNPLLNSALRGSRDLVETVSMSYSALKYGGLVLVSLTLDPSTLAAARRETLKFLRSSRNLNFGPQDMPGDERFFAFDYLGSAKNQIRFEMYRSQERGLSVASGLARYLLLGDPSIDRNYLQSVDRLTTSDLRQAAGRYLSGGKKVVVSIVPRGSRRRP